MASNPEATPRRAGGAAPRIALVFGEVLVGRRLGWTAVEFRQFGILAPEDGETWDGLLASAVGRWQGRGVNLVLLLLTLTITALWFWRIRDWLTGEWQVVGGRITLSGWWYSLISMPVLRFLMLLWLWRSGQGTDACSRFSRYCSFGPAGPLAYGRGC